MAENVLPRIADNTELSSLIAVDTSNILQNIQFSVDELALSMIEFIEFQRSEALRAQLDASNLIDAIKQSNPDTAPAEESENEGDSSFILADLGLLGTLAATLIGTTIGVITGQIAVVKTFAKAVSAFTPQSIVNLVSGMKAKMLKSLDTFGKGVTSAIDFVKTGITSGMSRIASVFSFADDAPIGRIATSFKNAIGVIAKPFNAAIEMIQSAVKTVRSVAKGAGQMFSVFGEFGGLVGSIARVVKTIFVPLGIVMAAIDTIKGAISGFQEEGILGGIEGAITGLLNSIIGAPLDLIKKAVSWVLGIFGFDNAKSTLESFSFSDLISDSIGAIFDMLKSSVNWIGDVFTDPVGALSSLWNGIVGDGGLVDLIFKPIDKAIAWVKGLFGFETTEESWTLSGAVKGAFDNAKAWLVDLFTFDTSEGLLAGIATKFMDIVYAPVDMAIAWVKGIFGWGDPEEEPFKVSDIVMDAFNAAKEWLIEKFSNITDMLPSIDDIKTSLMNKLPSWLIPDSAKTPEMRAQEIQAAIDEETARISRSKAGENEYYGLEGRGRERSAEEIARLRDELAQVQAQASNNQVVNVNTVNQGDNVNASTTTNAPSVINTGTDGRGFRPDAGY